MTKTPITLQDLRRRLYVKAKAEPSWRFWGLYTHVCKPDTLRAAYELAKQNDGAPGTDGVTFEAIEVDGVERFLDQLREELVQRRYRPQRPRKVGIPDFRRRLPTGVVRLPAEEVSAGGGPTRLRGHPAGQDLRH
jgi:RNA-directed DNA polymerase